MWESKYNATKKGNNEGTIEETHICKPDFAANKFDDEKSIKKIVKINKEVDKPNFLKYFKYITTKIYVGD